MAAPASFRDYVRLATDSGFAYPRQLFVSGLLAACPLPVARRLGLVGCAGSSGCGTSSSGSGAGGSSLQDGKVQKNGHATTTSNAATMTTTSDRKGKRTLGSRLVDGLQPPRRHPELSLHPWDEYLLTGVQPPIPECWGHRGASAAYPENTIPSFDRAIRDGSEGLESDVHVTSDDVIVMFHDPSLERTTNGTGLIREQPWHGGIELVRTKAKPQQQIPTFRQVCDLLMKPDNQHVKLNIDIKPDNDPDRLFRLMRETVESYPDFAEKLSPRLILGLWHPVFIAPALQHVPTLRRVHIGGSPAAARTYFWQHCDGFSMWFASLVGAEGQAFLEQARKDGKDVFVWTVNRKDEMIEATRWGVKAILTDKTDLFQTIRAEMQNDYPSTRSEEVGFFFRWTSWRYYLLPQFVIQSMWIANLEKRAGVSFKSAWQSFGVRHQTAPSVVVTSDGEKTVQVPTVAQRAKGAHVAAADVEKAALAAEASAVRPVSAVA